MFRRLLAAGLIFSAVVIAGSGTAHAARKAPAPAPTVSSIRINQTAPRLGDMVNFTVTYPSTLKATPRIDIYCYGNGALGWATAGNYYESFKLGGDWSAWKDAGGAASCVANLYWWSNNPGQPQTYNVLARTTFEAAG